jgi:hypothetical protein
MSSTTTVHVALFFPRNFAATVQTVPTVRTVTTVPTVLQPCHNRANNSDRADRDNCANCAATVPQLCKQFWPCRPWQLWQLCQQCRNRATTVQTVPTVPTVTTVPTVPQPCHNRANSSDHADRDNCANRAATNRPLRWCLLLRGSRERSPVVSFCVHMSVWCKIHGEKTWGLPDWNRCTAWKYHRSRPLAGLCWSRPSVWFHHLLVVVAAGICVNRVGSVCGG